MSQMLETKFPSSLYQDLVFQKRSFVLESSAKEATCYVCNKGLNEGYTITAKNTALGTLLFCDKHHSEI